MTIEIVRVNVTYESISFSIVSPSKLQFLLRCPFLIQISSFRDDNSFGNFSVDQFTGIINI